MSLRQYLSLETQNLQKGGSPSSNVPTNLMSSSFEGSTPRPSEIDTVTDLLDHFYSNAWEEEARIEYVNHPLRIIQIHLKRPNSEQEDVSLYGLYTRCAPRSCPKSAPQILKHDLSLKQPFDGELLAEKLWNYMKSAEHTRKSDSRHEQHKPDCTTKPKTMTPIGTSDGEPGGREYFSLLLNLLR